MDPLLLTLDPDSKGRVGIHLLEPNLETMYKDTSQSSERKGIVFCHNEKKW